MNRLLILPLMVYNSILISDFLFDLICFDFFIVLLSMKLDGFGKQYSVHSLSIKN